mmetsp:Transcript_15236/g.35314  ORF Transcript_15236/g.35314 Transcript_15236/m.35314 type:complete len:232 (+) Transcript_15236:441-1136(+)
MEGGLRRVHRDLLLLQRGDRRPELGPARVHPASPGRRRRSPEPRGSHEPGRDGIQRQPSQQQLQQPRRRELRRRRILPKPRRSAPVPAATGRATPSTQHGKPSSSPVLQRTSRRDASSGTSGRTAAAVAATAIATAVATFLFASERPPRCAGATAAEAWFSGSSRQSSATAAARRLSETARVRVSYPLSPLASRLRRRSFFFSLCDEKRRCVRSIPSRRSRFKTYFTYYVL